MLFNLFMLVLWILIGVVNLCSKEISKYQYACVWLVLIFALMAKALL
jgi:hypothetical protein